MTPSRFLPLLLLSTAACVNLAPPHARPELPTAPAYDAEYRPAGAARATDVAWRDFFGDPRLRALIDTALVNNRDLVVATARIEEARGQFRIQRSARFPEVGVSGSVTRSRTPLNANPAFAVGSGQTGDDDVDEEVGESGSDIPSSITLTNYQVALGVTAYELDFWGRVRNLSDAALATYLSTVSAQRAFRLSLIADVASNYFIMLENAERIDIAESTLESRLEELEIAEQRLNAGVTSALDFRQAQSLLTQAETELASLRLAQAETRNALSVLIGGPVRGALPEGRTLEEQDLIRNLQAGLPSELLLNRPDIIGAEYDLLAARANVGAARAAFFPTISLTGSIGFSSIALDELVGEDGLSWSFGPSIDLPIFDWGRREGNLDVARAREVIQVANYERTVQTAFQEVSDSLARRRWLAEQVEAQDRNVEALSAIARLARLRYDEGVAQYLEVLDAERQLFAARQNRITLERQLAESYVGLYIALGGGTEAAAANVAPPEQDPDAVPAPADRAEG